MNIFNKVATKKLTEQQDARSRYYNLLARLDLHASSDADAAELETLLGDLGISHDRAAVDHRTIQDALNEHAIAARFDETNVAIGPVSDKFLAACAARQTAYQ